MCGEVVGLGTQILALELHFAAHAQALDGILRAGPGQLGHLRRGHLIEVGIALRILVQSDFREVQTLEVHPEVVGKHRPQPLLDKRRHLVDVALNLQQGNLPLRRSIGHHRLGIAHYRSTHLLGEVIHVELHHAVQRDERLVVRNVEEQLPLDRHRHGVVQEPGVRDVELRDEEGQTDVARQVDEVDFGLEGGLPSEHRPQDARKHGEVGRLERRVERTFEVVHLLAVVLAIDEDRHLALLDAERTAPPDGILAAARHPCGRPFPHQIIGFVAADDIQDAAFRLVFAEKSHLILPFFSIWPYPTHNAAQPGRQMRPRRPSGRRQNNYLQSSGRTPGRPSSPGNR